MVAVVAAAAVLAPIATNESAAQSTSGASGGVVIIANGWSPPDVGAAAPLAGRLDAAVLYASTDDLGQPTIDALAELDPGRVLLMGGTAALTPSVESEVRRALSGVTVERFSGTDRVDTAARAALSEPAVPAGQPVVIANGWSPSDVGTAAPLAAQLGGSVLYTGRGELGGPTVTALRRLAPSRVVIVGGLGAVGADVESRIGSVVPGAAVERLSGVDRVDTAALAIDLADVTLGGPVVLANGWSAPDVGIAAPVAATLDGSVLLTERSGLGERTAEAIDNLNPSHIILIGGTKRFAAAVDADLERLHSGIPRVNVAGADRITTAAIAALFEFEFAAEQRRFEDAVATITPGRADCGTAPPLDVAGIEVVDRPDGLNDLAAPLTVAEVARIAGSCAIVDYVKLDGRSVADIRELLDGQPGVFAVSEPLRGIEPLHDRGAHSPYGPDSGTHHNDGSGEQWHLPAKYMQELWDGWERSNPIAVAIIDSGVDASHPDLQGRVNAAGLSHCHITDSWDTNPRLNDGGMLSPGGHGTHVAGIIAARAGNGGVAGVAPDATIIPVNIWDDWNWTDEDVPTPGGGITDVRHDGKRSCLSSVLADGLPHAVGHAVNNGARVINMSFGVSFTVRPQDDSCGGPDRGIDRFRPDQVPIARTAIKKILGRKIDPSACDAFRLMLEITEAMGVVAVAGAGNCGEQCDAFVPVTYVTDDGVSDAFTLPAGYDDSVIAVAAVDANGDRAAFSTARDYVDIAAPGVAILSTVPSAKPGTDDYEAWNGTSMAAPFVAGVVAHMLNRYPDAEPWQVRRALADSAYPGPTPNWAHPDAAQRKVQYGHGIVQPKEAILRLGNLTNPNRTPNRINSLQVTGRTCPFSDDTPNCADPAPLPLQPRFAATAYPSLRHYTVAVPSEVDHLSVKTDYDNNARPGSILFYPADADFRTADHQVRFPTGNNTTELTIFLPDWNGLPAPNPYKITFRRAEPDKVATAAGATIDAGADHACALRPDGNAECWGKDDDGQADPPSGAFTAISAGHNHTCGLRPNGNAECWGKDDDGQADPPSGAFTAISAGDNHTCGLRPNGNAECWGKDDDGQVDSPSGAFTAISAGHNHTCGLRPNGNAECWGNNWKGISDAPSGAFTAISAGHWHSCALRTDGSAECWGENGVGDADPPSGTFIAITAGGGHSCGLRPDGSAECWGRNEHGQLDPPSGVFITITAGYFHACGLRLDGSAGCWGSNLFEQTDPPSGQFRTEALG